MLPGVAVYADPPASGATAESAPAKEAGRAPRLLLGHGDEGVAYVDEATCLGCHADQAAAWRPSDHAKAMQPATAETVLGDFADARFGEAAAGEGGWRFFRRDGRFLAATAGADGTRQEFEVLYTFGVDPLQQYLVAGPRGRLQVLSVAWDVPRARWIDLYADAPAPPGDAMHWTGRYQAWNAMCADCHSTNLKKNYDPATDAYATTWSVIDVGCQACHGPGARHVEWAKAPAPDRARGDGLVAAGWLASAKGELETCAPCHSRRSEIAGADRHFHPFLDDYVPRTLDEGLYFADGQIDAEVYVYGSFLQSRMHQAGVRCSDCHDPHSLSLRAEGNALCTRCHTPEPEKRFPGLVGGVYDAKSHHHHEPGSDGASCVSCHMPERTYMVVDPRRDHSLRVPRPDLSVTLGVPNACNGCHAKESASWAADRIREWYGPERRRGADWAATFHDGRRGDPSMAPALSALSKPGGAPPIVRATAVTLLPAMGVGGLEALVAAIADPDPLVRLHAVSGLAMVLPPQQSVSLLLPLLSDEVRAVRADAGRALAVVPDGVLEPAQQKRLDRAIEEYEAGQLANADLPAGRINLALLYANRGRVADAEREYRAAIAQDPLFLPPIANLAQLLSADGRPDQAEALLRDAITRLPGEGELHYSLGLLIAETGRLEEARPALEQAALLMPDRPRVQYNYGLVLEQLGRSAQAGSVLARAARQDPREPAFAQALAIHHLQAGDFRAARDEALRWRELAPADPNAKAVLLRAEQGLQGSAGDAR